MTLNTVALMILFKDKDISHSHVQCLLLLPDYITTSLEMEKSVFTPCLDELFSLWNNAIHHMKYLVCTAGRYKAMCILGRVHAAFFNCHQFDAMPYMPDQIIWARMMTALDLEFEKALHYHDEGYESDNNYGLPAEVMRPVCIFQFPPLRASFNTADYKEALHTISPSPQDDPGITCPSVNGSASAKHLMTHPYPHKNRLQ